MEEKDREKIRQIIKDRGIRYLFHFTPLNNLDYILKERLKSRKEIEQERDKYPDSIFPDDVRADRRKNGICLSISFPNDEMFPRFRQRIDGNWAIIVLDIDLILEIKDQKILFFDTNSANSKFRNIDDKSLETAIAFESLFAEKVSDKYKTWRRPKPENESMFYKMCPTSVQAEVMVTSHIETDYIKAVILDTKELASYYCDKYKYLYTYYGRPDTYMFPLALYSFFYHDEKFFGFFYDEEHFGKREDYLNNDLNNFEFWQ